MRRFAVCCTIGLLLLTTGCTLLDRFAAPAPLASLTATPQSGAAPLPVRFTGTGNGGSGQYVEYAWTFGDGTEPASSIGPQVEHVYSHPGTFTAHVTVTDSNGNAASAKIAIEATNTPPIAAFRLSNDAPVPGELVQYDGAGSIDLDGEIVDFIWDFGDDESMRGTRVSHVYDEVGIYTVRLTVVDDAGDSASSTHDVDVHADTGGGSCSGGGCVGLY